jgi:hypothetical protein
MVYLKCRKNYKHQYLEINIFCHNLSRLLKVLINNEQSLLIHCQICTLSNFASIHLKLTLNISNRHSFIPFASCPPNCLFWYLFPQCGHCSAFETVPTATDRSQLFIIFNNSICNLRATIFNHCVKLTLPVSDPKKEKKLSYLCIFDTQKSCGKCAQMNRNKCRQIQNLKKTILQFPFKITFSIFSVSWSNSVLRL